MPKTALPEWILARFVGHDRASVILGDLLEISTTRGCLWFWSAYARTLITLGWRTPVAFLCAYYFSFSYWSITARYASMHWLFRWVPLAGSDYRMPFWQHHLQPLVSVLSMLFGLNFLLPFVLVRFGLRDRLTQLASILFLVSLPASSNRLLLLMPMEILAVIAVVLALCLRDWRRPMIVLAAALTLSYAIVEGFVSFLRESDGSVVWSHRLSVDAVLLQIAAAAVVCSLLHRWMLEQPQASGQVELAGGSNA
jgi:hypothetical protein